MVIEKERKKCYYIADGIYFKCRIFIDTIVHRFMRKHETFVGAQKDVQKDLEHVFGVLISRWYILAKPCTFLDRWVCKKVMKVSIIRHNMIEIARRGGNDSFLFEEELSALNNGKIMENDGSESQFNWDS